MTVRWSSHGVRRDLLKAAFSEWFGIEGGVCDVLVALFDLDGEQAAWQALAIATDSHRPPTQGAMWERIRILRKAMDCEAIDCDAGSYSLTEIGMSECRRALAELGTQLTAIGGGMFEEEEAA